MSEYEKRYITEGQIDKASILDLIIENMCNDGLLPDDDLHSEKVLELTEDEYNIYVKFEYFKTDYSLKRRKKLKQKKKEGEK